MAVLDLNQALLHRPVDASLLEHRGRVHEGMGDTTQATADFKAALATGAQDIAQLAEVYVRMITTRSVNKQYTCTVHFICVSRVASLQCSSNSHSTQNTCSFSPISLNSPPRGLHFHGT